MTHYGLVSYMCYGERRRETLHAGVSCIIDARACRRSDVLFPHMFPMRRGPFIHWWHTGGSVGKPAAEHTLAYTLQKGIVYCYSADTHSSFHTLYPKTKIYLAGQARFKMSKNHTSISHLLGHRKIASSWQKWTVLVSLGGFDESSLSDSSKLWFIPWYHWK